MHKYQAQRETYTREDIVDERLRGRANYKFVFVHWPGQWELLETSEGKYELLPRLKRNDLNPGCNGVKWGTRKAGNYGKVNASAYFSYLDRSGAIYIKNDTPVVYTGEDGKLVEDVGYLWSLTLSSGSKFFIDPWDNPTQSRRGGIDMTGRDEEGYRAWKRMLVATGVIPEPTSADLTEIIKLQTRRAARNAKSAAGNPAVQKQVAKEEARLRALLDEQNRRFKSQPKRKAPKRGKRKGVERASLE